MQIQPYSSNSMPYNKQSIPAGSTPHVTNPASSNATTVTLSDEAKELTRVDPIPQPNTPEIGNIKAGVEQYANIQAAKMKSQVASDMTSIAMGTSDGISAPTAYYLSHNDSAREATVAQMANQQQVSTMQAYVDASESINEWA